MYRSLAEEQKQELRQKIQNGIFFDEPASKRTLIGSGGSVASWAIPDTGDLLRELMIWAREHHIPSLVIGKASNLLVREGGFSGLVLETTKAFRHFEVIREEGKKVFVEAGSGVPVQQLVSWGSALGFKGVEQLAPFSGTVGGLVSLYNGDGSEKWGKLIQNSVVWDGKGKEKIYGQLSFPGTPLVLSTQFQFEKEDSLEVEKEVQKRLEQRAFHLPIAELHLPFIFKNPSGRKAETLIDEAGLRGVRVGRVRISERHANCIVNEGGGEVKDILILIRLVKDRVKETSNIVLESTIKIIGDEA